MIHTENPFRPGPGEGDPTRRFRGRLAAGVTIVTAGDASQRTGLTVSSLIVVEGEPAIVYLQVGPTTDLWSLLADVERFVVHVCRYEHLRLADSFAGLRPAPGGMFVGVQTTDSVWGPLLDDLPDRARCSLLAREETGWSGLVTGRIDEVEVSELTDPLIHFRGGYRRLRE
ncbi:MAG TPA: flavin reductase family protein [Acidimicrobiia bacterium]